MALRLMDSMEKARQEEARPVPAPPAEIPLAAPTEPPVPVYSVSPEKGPKKDSMGSPGPEEGPDATEEGLSADSGKAPAERPAAKPARKPGASMGARVRGKAEPIPRRSIRDLPGSLVEMAVRSSGDAGISNIRAVEAFLFAYRDRSLDDQIDYSDITDEVASLAAGFDTSRRERDRDRRLQRMERQLAALDDAVDKALWAVIYLVWHSTGLRTDAPVSPDEIGFAQDFDGFEATLRSLSKAVKAYGEDRARREGRPIR